MFDIFANDGSTVRWSAQRDDFEVIVLVKMPGEPLVYVILKSSSIL